MLRPDGYCPLGKAETISSVFDSPDKSSLVDCWLNSAPTSTSGVTKPSRRPHENASFGSTRLKSSPFTLYVPPLTPSLNVQPAVALSSTRGSCACAVPAASANGYCASFW